MMTFRVSFLSCWAASSRHRSRMSESSKWCALPSAIPTRSGDFTSTCTSPSGRLTSRSSLRRPLPVGRGREQLVDEVAAEREGPLPRGGHPRAAVSEFVAGGPKALDQRLDVGAELESRPGLIPGRQQRGPYVLHPPRGDLTVVREP